MKFGLFYEHQLPRPYDADQWDPDAEHRLFKNALDQIELADKLGFVCGHQGYMMTASPSSLMRASPGGESRMDGSVLPDGERLVELSLLLRVLQPSLQHGPRDDVSMYGVRLR